MTLGRQQAYSGMPVAALQGRTGSNEGNQAYLVERQNMVGSYTGHYGTQSAGGYHNVPEDEGWTQRVIDEMKDLLLLLDAQGRINYASPSSKQITGRIAKQLEGSLLTQYIHEDDKTVFLRDMDDAVATNQPFRAHLRFQKTNSTYCLLEAYGHPHIAAQNSRQGENASDQDRCTGFFLMCRPYPSKISQLLDSFLEHKIENARLVQQIAKLKQEEDEEANATRTSYNRLDVDKGATLAENQDLLDPSRAVSSEQDSTETAGANSDESDTNPSVDYFSEKRYHIDALSHIDGIEVMTGLRYGDGERSQGLSTGVRRGRLVQCDIDVTTTADQARNAQEGDRRKRLKSQHVCGDCGTADSPEWRKGPGGPKTLCNACGLRWSKKEKRRQESA
ncbi:transcriptional regulator family: GATA type zinc finger [Penicillium alfredii]|uniref:Transcriptional regulator family: GATA type zinc finger n=1 Tax=Penicillium alfredii TaxID=1506179 RepID=A0A9W9ERU4_9EURO|nr:transcriptional regulator family: GATA type zinc finger [Penicillium alfredii]KAJ5086705.1 transcriptional regulator family: GATA type zinc finger [Penicillium alfredii]